jgi:MFS family permease
VLGLGTAWILDGLEITIASSVTSKLTQANTLALSTSQASAIGTGLLALAFRGGGGIVYFYLTRFIAGTGIGGEYSAVNSAIDEMMPARYRGRTDIWKPLDDTGRKARSRINGLAPGGAQLAISARRDSIREESMSTPTKPGGRDRGSEG